MPSEVFAAFCLTAVGQGYIANIDASEIQVRQIVTKVDVGNLGMVFVSCCIRCKILVRNTVTMANTLNLRTVPVSCCIRHRILMRNTVAKVNSLSLGTDPVFMISNFCSFLNVVCFLLGNSPVSEFYMPTFWNTLSVPSL
jgi:hypothetical protein